VAAAGVLPTRGGDRRETHFRADAAAAADAASAGAYLLLLLTLAQQVLGAADPLCTE